MPGLPDTFDQLFSLVVPVGGEVTSEAEIQKVLKSEALAVPLLTT